MTSTNQSSKSADVKSSWIKTMSGQKLRNVQKGWVLIARNDSKTDLWIQVRNQKTRKLERYAFEKVALEKVEYDNGIQLPPGSSAYRFNRQYCFVSPHDTMIPFVDGTKMYFESFMDFSLTHDDPDYESRYFDLSGSPV